MSALLLVLVAWPVEAQTLRQQRRIQKRLEKADARKSAPPAAGTKGLAPNGEAGSAASGAQTAEISVKTKGHSLDGVRQNPQKLFSPEEQSLIIRGFGRPPALLILFRQLDLTTEQKQGIRAIRDRVGFRLVTQQNESQRLENELEEAIYGEAYDAKRVETLAAQAADKQGEVLKLRASIESQIRELLTPDQLFAYRFLIGELLLPNRRVQPAQLLRQQQMQQRRNLPNRPPAQTVPPPDSPDDM
ncbi:MAG: Spy/CpxP family protein refolding chaperone [Blastocatellia bacterium]|nr:Spy/CpxP family protein refolding chaperone [Blastocatellia bacterium]